MPEHRTRIYTRPWLWVGLIAGVVVLGVGVLAVRWLVVRAGEPHALAMAREHLQRNDVVPALEAARTWRGRSATPAAWAGIEVAALGRMRHLELLMARYRNHPEHILYDEDASRLVAVALMVSDDATAAQTIITHWRGHSPVPQPWTWLQADLAKRAGRTAYAQELLLSSTAAGRADVPRMLRLAALAPAPARAQMVLSAIMLDGKSVDAWTAWAELLDAEGRSADAECALLLAAEAAGGTQPVPWERLALRRLREGRIDEAQAAWRQAMRPGAPASMWVEHAAWSRLVTDAPTPALCAATQALSVWAAYVMDVPASRFWDEVAAARLPQLDRVVRQRSSLAWLVWLQRFRDGDVNGCHDFAVGHAEVLAKHEPLLAHALSVLAALRAKRDVPPIPGILEGIDRTRLHPVMQQALAVSEGSPSARTLWRALAHDPAAPAAILAAADWSAAAVRLLPATAAGMASATVGEWPRYAIACALRRVRGATAARAWLGAREQLPPASALLASELDLLLSPQTGVAGLTTLATASEPRDVAYRAAWLLCEWHMEHGDWNAARAVWSQARAFADSDQGRETAARIASGLNEPQAEQLWMQLGERTPAARVRLAQRAIARQDVREAARLMQGLQRDFPESLALRKAALLAHGQAQRQP